MNYRDFYNDLIKEATIPFDKDEYEKIKAKTLALYRKMKAGNLGYSWFYERIDNYLKPVDLMIELMVSKKTKNFDGCYNGSRLDPQISIYLPPNSYSLGSYAEEKLLHVLDHEYNHFLQYMRSWGRSFKYGSSKKDIASKEFTFHGDRPEKGYLARNVQPHDLRSVEFKPLLNSFSGEFKRLTRDVTDENEKKALFLLFIGKYSDSQLSSLGKEYGRVVKKITNSDWKLRLDKLHRDDSPRWKLMVKEMYAEIF